MSNMEEKSDSKRDRILKAATECFTQYGFKRTTMDDIARGAGISRAALYLLFQNKEDIFRTLSEQLYRNSITRAEAALQSNLDFSDRLIAAFEGKNLELVELVKSSSHGSELVDLNHAIGADIFYNAEQQFEELLAQAIQQAESRGEIVLSDIGFNSKECAALLISCTHGLKKSSSSLIEYRQHLKHLVSVFSQALAVKPRS
jgi:AcrR family transcriptional regulator